MKKINITLILALFMLGFVSSCGPTQADAIKNNDAIIEQQKILLKEYDKVVEASGDVAKVENAIKEYNSQCTKSIEIVEKMDNFGKETAFKDAALTLFKLFKSVGDNELKEMLRILKIPAENLTKADDDLLMTNAKQADEKLEKELDSFIKSQKNYAEKWKIVLINK
jgi:hypothetical protein